MNSPFLWHELSSPNAAESIEFYTTVFGWTNTSMDMGEMGMYHIFRNEENDNGFAGVMQSGGPGMENIPPHWAMYLQVPDVDASVATIIANGGNVCVPAMDVPEVGRMALVADPHGASFWVMTPAMRG